MRGPIDLNVNAPTASAIRYDGIGRSCVNRHTPSAGGDCGLCALISAHSPGGTWIVASYVNRTPGESCSGIQLRARIAWDCVNSIGARLPAVPAGSSHSSAEAAGRV